MINLIMAYDDDDSELGEYFELSYHHINDRVIALPFISSISLRGLDCTESTIVSTIENFAPETFVFIGLSHGDETGFCLLTNNDEFVKADNILHYERSFFYTTACEVANDLGKRLILGNCQCFIGCNNSSLATFEEFYQVYADCENYSIREFFETEKSIQQTFEEMKGYFDLMIDKYSNEGEILFSMELENNKECMVLLGNGALNRNDFLN